MFDLIRLTAEKLELLVERVLDYRRVEKDSRLGAQLLSVFTAIQDIYLLGLKIVTTIEELSTPLSPAYREEVERRLDDLIQNQLASLPSLQNSIDSLREVISTVDGSFSFELAPILDKKSGLLTRLQQEGRYARNSTTFLLFLDYDALLRVYELIASGEDYRRYISDEVSRLRETEIRDYHALDSDKVEILRTILALRAPKEQLEKIKEIASAFHAKIDAQIGLKAIRQKRVHRE